MIECKFKNGNKYFKNFKNFKNFKSLKGDWAALDEAIAYDNLNFAQYDFRIGNTVIKKKDEGLRDMYNRALMWEKLKLK